jgi:hypothetical protein
VSEHDQRRLGSRQHVPFTGSMRRGLGPAGFQSCATAGAVRVVPAGRLRDVRGGIDRDEGSSSSRGEEGLPYAGTLAHEPWCFAANGVDVESTEAGEVNHRATVSEGPGSANCAGSRAPPTVTVMHAPTGQRDAPDQGSA